MAHAGGENENPPETLYAFGQAAAEGVPILDMDLQITSDGVPVVMHNNTVDSTTNGTGAVFSMTFAQVHALDAAYWYADGCGTCHGKPTADYLYRGIRTGSKAAPAGYSAEDFAVPSLDEVFQRFPHAYFDIEIKDDAGDVTRLAQATADLIHEHGLASHVVIASFGGPGMTTFRTDAPDVATSATQNEVESFFLSGTVPRDAQILDVPPTYDLGGTTIQVVTPAFVKKAHAAGLAVWVWMNSGDQQNADLLREVAGHGSGRAERVAPVGADGTSRPSGDAWDPNAPVTSTTPPGTATTVPSTTTPRTAPVATPAAARPTYTG